MKPLSRTKRWAAAAAKADEGLSELIELQGEFQDWLDNLPENLGESPVGTKLEEVCEIDLEECQSVVQEAEGLDLPLGFGRD